MEFKCNHCNKNFKSYQSRWNHNNKYHKIISPQSSTSCPQLSTSGPHLPSIELQIKNNICKYCNKELCNRKSRWRHELNCKLNNNNIKKQNQIAKNIVNGNINNTLNDNKQIIINNFGNYNTECLTDQFKKKLIKEFIFEEDHVNIIPMLIEKLNFNPDYKENNNAKISSLRSKVGYKYEGRKWIAVEKEALLNDLFKIGDELVDKMIEKLDNIPLNIKDGYDDFQGNKDLLKKTMKEKIEMTCYLYFQNCEDNYI